MDFILFHLHSFVRKRKETDLFQQKNNSDWTIFHIVLDSATILRDILPIVSSNLHPSQMDALLRVKNQLGENAWHFALRRDEGNRKTLWTYIKDFWEEIELKEFLLIRNNRGLTALGRAMQAIE